MSLDVVAPPVAVVALAAPAALLLALAVDRRWGEPPLALHPVVAMGRWLGWAGRPWPGRAPALAFTGGLLAWWAGALMVLAVALAAQIGIWALWAGPWPAVLLGVLLQGLLLKPLLAWRMLHDEVAAVEAALAEGLDAGRARVARLCSRDTAALDAVQVRETAIETLAENLNDSVLAPLAWAALAGLPGAALYRYANTADAMWGYRGRWEWAGKWAARSDDVASAPTARLAGWALRTAGLGPASAPAPASASASASAGGAGEEVAAAADPASTPPQVTGAGRPVSAAALRAEARRTPSPNGGWPMGAMALVLGVRLGKPGVYVLNAAGRAAAPGDIGRALQLARRALRRSLVPLLGLALLAGGLWAGVPGTALSAAWRLAASGVSSWIA
ncbi:CobD/CbiB family cobalamin biosynthesis protein [Pseudaquabacterium rugosum]|uniref:Cobalamin biosynthesis protein CobD n=1 Tax=Pseudaquabacterium rugosum TaxID=2984194 RepID=A0ABU9BD98_9BURK